ncbi:uncharacterized protein CCOS01_10485 [Colletotrichum costaricense]|uniref:Uncharacterized protein n=1 Tax=Colletotrichum costaricense TaxID=1209916 RepID=A0AAI9YRA1_9PEZI|nr:uncharacterized protein CCOS01_10485 [Colletotrichum costaricense]KAK1520366.1 hypothetical protein CCOS01_10485 [Colletotrichum costaricense]
MYQYSDEAANCLNSRKRQYSSLRYWWRQQLSKASLRCIDGARATTFAQERRIHYRNEEQRLLSGTRFVQISQKQHSISKGKEVLEHACRILWRIR